MSLTTTSSLNELTEVRNEIISILIKENYKEAKFPKDKSLFIIYDNSNLYCIIKYEKLPIEEDKDYYKELRKIFSEETTICLYNLFFIIGNKFGNFHLHHKCPSGNRLYHAAIICSNNDYDIIRRTMNLIISQDKHNTDYTSIKYIELKNKYLIVIDIATFYHIFNSGIFGYRNKIPLEILKNYKY